MWSILQIITLYSITSIQTTHEFHHPQIISQTFQTDITRHQDQKKIIPSSSPPSLSNQFSFFRYHQYSTCLPSNKCPHDSSIKSNDAASSNQILQSINHTGWISRIEMEELLKSYPNNDSLLSYITDATYYENDTLAVYHRIYNNEILTTNSPTTSISNLPKIELLENVLSKTYKWCENFVQELNLCPWVKSSLQKGKYSSNIRMKLLQISGYDTIERIIRESSIELLKLTNTTNDYSIDGNAAITFVILVPNENKSGKLDEEVTFFNFYNFYTYLEDKLLDEADAHDNSVGNDITIAPFHPNWTYYSHNNEQEQVMDYEKRSPYPMISIVRTDVIEHAGGEDITDKIARNNEEVLCGRFGSIDDVEKFYEENVLK